MQKIQIHPGPLWPVALLVFPDLWLYWSSLTCGSPNPPSTVTLMVLPQLWLSWSSLNCDSHHSSSIVALLVLPQLWLSWFSLNCDFHGPLSTVDLLVFPQLWLSWSFLMCGYCTVSNLTVMRLLVPWQGREVYADHIYGWVFHRHLCTHSRLFDQPFNFEIKFLLSVPILSLNLKVNY